MLAGLEVYKTKLGHIATPGGQFMHQTKILFPLPIGPHFVIAIRHTLVHDWYEALEYHWLALFNIIIYVMKFGWHLQRAEVQKRARVHSSI